LRGAVISLSRDFREVKRPWYSHGPGLLVVIAAFAGLVLAARVFVVEPFRVQAASMQPSIEPGGRLIVKKWGTATTEPSAFNSREPASHRR